MGKLGLTLLVTSLLLSGCGASQSANKPADSSSEASSSKLADTAATGDAQKKIKVTVEGAIRQFHQEFGNTAVVTELAIEPIGPRYAYELTGVDSNHEYELTVDAQSGKQSRVHREKLDADEDQGVARKQEGLDTNQLKSLATITRAATQKVSGHAISWSLDRENGQAQWEVKVKSGRTYHEVTLDASTGKVLATERDDD
ncbi:PepSY domain-containing protein [Levilactobacillus yonginensis]|uniref:PepSY domain-containing protein n=1 Tax=Levilactobacillus yonginensis TaxID=1054041 RepID=UPI00345CF461